MVDTSGWAFMYPLLRLSGVRVACYTHYPTISTDMLRRVQTRQAAFNNSSSITGSTLKSAAKLLYYYIFAAMYGAVGGCANVSVLLPACACTECDHFFGQPPVIQRASHICRW